MVSKSHVWKHVFANRIQLKLSRSLGQKLLKDRYHEIIYEELIAQPEPILRDLCKYIGIPFDETMLDFGCAAKTSFARRD